MNICWITAGLITMATATRIKMHLSLTAWSTSSTIRTNQKYEDVLEKLYSKIILS